MQSVIFRNYLSVSQDSKGKHNPQLENSTMSTDSLNATSDDEIDLYPEPETTSRVKTFRNTQSDVTVASEIQRGNKLRGSKPIPYLPNERYPVIIDLPKPPIAHKRKFRNVLSKPCPGCSHWATVPCSKSMTSVHNPSKIKRLKFRKKVEKKTICPLRIAELAVPSKRHCIDTWRHKSYLLPEEMVERLKQHVMDQRPIIQLSDAVHYFKRRKPRSPKKDCFCGPVKDIVNCWKKQMELPLPYQKGRTLCIVFAQKILQRLSIPLKLTINSDLEKISQVVASDIVRITKGKKYMNSEYIKNYRRVHADLINKITVWIAGILEDITYKQLEEDLRDLEEEEGPVLDFLDDLLENVLNICLPKPTEEYIAEDSKKSSSSGSLDSKRSDDALTDVEFLKKQITKIIDQIGIAEDSDKDDIHTEIHNILNKILKDSVASNDTITYDNDLTDTEYFRKAIIDLISFVPKESGDTNGILENLVDNDVTDPQYFQNVIFNLIDAFCKESEDNIAKNINDMIIQQDDNVEGDQLEITQSTKDNTQDDNIEGDQLEITQSAKENTQDGNIEGDQFEIIQSTKSNTQDDDIEGNQLETSQSTESNIKGSVDALSEGTDDRSKKVMFSVLDIVNTDDTANLSKITDQSNTAKESETFTYIHPKDNLIFAEANQNLLSDADELWPSENFTPALLRPSASITKSITSLGKLSEYDEKDLSLSPLDSSIVEQENEYTIRLSSEEKQSVTSPTTNVGIGDVKEQSMNKSQTKSEETLTSLNEDIASLIKYMQSLLLSDEVEKCMTNDPTRRDKSVQASTDAVHRDTASQTTEVKAPTLILKKSKTIITSIGPESVAEDNNNITVPPETDVLKNKVTIDDRTVNKKSYSQLAKHVELTQSDIHNWYKALDIGFKNLEIWQSWIQNSCKETNDLLKRKSECLCCNNNCTQVWRNLKNNVDKDAILFRKMNRKTHERLIYFQKYYHKKKVETSNCSLRCNCKLDTNKTMQNSRI